MRQRSIEPTFYNFFIKLVFFFSALILTKVKMLFLHYIFLSSLIPIQHFKIIYLTNFILIMKFCSVANLYACSVSCRSNCAQNPHSIFFFLSTLLGGSNAYYILQKKFNSNSYSGKKKCY